VTDRFRALVTAPVRGAGLDLLHEIADLVIDPWIEHTPLRLMNAEQLADRLRQERADVVICEADECKGPVLELGLRAICSTRGDPTNVDVAGATTRGIPVLRAPGRNADAVAEMAIALLFAANRHVVRADRDVRDGEIYRDGTIPYQRFRAWELNGRTAGLVGLGAVGRALQWRLEGLGLRVISYDPYNPAATHSLDALLDEADVVSMHAPVTPETTGMMGAKEFGRLRPGSIYLNTARAQLHDDAALVDALQGGPLAAAGLDHFVGEFLAPDHPLATMANVVLAPHIGGATYNTEANHTRIIAEGLAQLMRGERPQCAANPEVFA
jgi:D-3-phosphoglycerate dehydrogenase